MDMYLNLTIPHCNRCGGELELVNGRYTCHYCGTSFDVAKAEAEAKNLREMFDEVKLEQVYNRRRNLYDAVTAEFISREDVKQACDELKRFIPDDFAANFYRITAEGNLRALNKAIFEIDPVAHYDDVGTIVNYLVRSLTSDEDCMLALLDLVERAYKKRDLKLFDQYETAISQQAERVLTGVYETKLPRDVFVAYSSKDMRQVLELVGFLEEQGFSCFVASRNLRHGVGSVENYDRALKEAIDHCITFVYISSMNSRNAHCDALRVEMDYVRSQDISRAPAQHFNNYARIPHQYKKPRVEYRIQESDQFNVADRITDEFFDGYERVYNPAEVAERVMQHVVLSKPASTAHTAPKEERPPVSQKSNDRHGGKKFDLRSFLSHKKPSSKTATEKMEPAPAPAPVSVPEPAPAPMPAPAQRSRPKSPFRLQSAPGGAPSTGLLSERTRDGKGIKITGIGSCTDTALVIPSKIDGLPVVEIGENAFSGCKMLKSVWLPEGLTTIAASAFNVCSGITSMYIPNGVTTIGHHAFSGCRALTELALPASLMNLESWAFNGCADVDFITVDESNPLYHSEDDCLIETDTGTLVRGCQNSLIPSYVTCIGNSAFAGCDTLKRITIPVGVTRLDHFAFSHCGLSNITYLGTKDEWKAIQKNSWWNANTPSCTVRCSDGDIHI